VWHALFHRADEVDRWPEGVVGAAGVFLDISCR
jgi:hypothetical protein